MNQNNTDNMELGSRILFARISATFRHLQPVRLSRPVFGLDANDNSLRSVKLKMQGS